MDQWKYEGWWTKKQSNRKTDIFNWIIFYLAVVSCSALKWRLRTTVSNIWRACQRHTGSSAIIKSSFPKQQGLHARSQGWKPAHVRPACESVATIQELSLSRLVNQVQLVISKSLEHTTLRAGVLKEVGWHLGPPPLKNCQWLTNCFIVFNKLWE